VTVHPLDDGNGRVARAIADMALARSEKSRQRFYSMSTQIQQEREAYYDILEQAQKGTMDITPWMDWFVGCLGRAVDGAQTILGAVLVKARFLGEPPWSASQQAPDSCSEPSARRLRRQTHHIKVRQTHEELARHRAARHSPSG